MSWLLNNPIGDRWHETVRHYAELHEQHSLDGSLTTGQLADIAAVYVRAKCSEYIRRGIDLLEQLDAREFPAKFCLVYLSIAYIRIHEFDLATNCLRRLKQLDPQSRQVLELEECLRERRIQHQIDGSNVSSIRLSSDTDYHNHNHQEEQELAALVYHLNSTAIMTSK